VAKGFESDSGAGGGGKGLTNDTLGTLVRGHTPRLLLDTDLGVPEEVYLTAVGTMGFAFPG
jgi:hypothetical protein